MPDRKPKQRLFDIVTGEISFVDFPANEEEFLVVKRREGLGMGTENRNAGANLEGGIPAPTDDQVVGNEELVKAIGDLTAALSGGAASGGGVKKEGDEEGGGEAASGSELPAKLKSALVSLYRMIGEALGTSEPAGKKESDGDAAAEKGVQKGGKRVNATRKGRIVTALKELIGLMDDLDPDALKDLLSKADDDEDDGKKKDEDEDEGGKKKTKAKKEDAVVGEEEEEDGKKKPTKTSKSDGAVELVETLKGLSARMERVEGATGVSKVEKAEGDEQGSGNIWNGVL